MIVLAGMALRASAWGFYAHRLINRQAVFLLPPEMLVLYKQHISFLDEHAVDPDKRRYAVAAEAPRHFIDLDRYGPAPFVGLPRHWEAALAKFGDDSLQAGGIVPWWVQTMLQRLTAAFRARDQSRILKLSAEIGHYLADAHVPLHACSNHNGQYTGQRGIHGFWESRVPELLAEKEWDFLVGRAVYIRQPADFIWNRVCESAAASDSVLRLEKQLDAGFSPDRKYAFEPRSSTILRQYSAEYTVAYNILLNNMVERRMGASILAVASFWYTAWVDAGQPTLTSLANQEFSTAEQQAFGELDRQWRAGTPKGLPCD